MDVKLTRGLLFIAYTLPLVVLLMLSFAGQWTYPAVLPDWELRNWASVLRPDGLGALLFTSVILAVAVSVIGTALGFFTGWLLLRSRRRKLLLWLALVPFCTAPVITAANLQFYFAWSGISATLAGVLLAQLFIAVPYSFILFSTFWTADRKVADDAGRTLGASVGERLWRIHRPAARPIILLSLVQLFLFSWFEYGLTQLLGVGQVRTLTTSVLQFTLEGNRSMAAVACCLLVLPPALFLLFSRKIRIADGLER